MVARGTLDPECQQYWLQTSKWAHYLKIPPRYVFLSQIISTVLMSVCAVRCRNLDDADNRRFSVQPI
ncbi:hypothetical protein DL89DRAFT_318947 [Linderina pennispora]|uniref:Uncharacterized protein n=1 Tax=Linderina pennispora TaxID=61395 RepID=A0A1Y1VT47_9FUNG|nr:uncharacterized protein DL89DRAFT_318947 [Linderina pennispora]ORX64458.1 hypothetical protein DL89DRAFT_318947 [Linderina pennispora]